MMISFEQWRRWGCGPIDLRNLGVVIGGQQAALVVDRRPRGVCSSCSGAGCRRTARSSSRSGGGHSCSIQNSGIHHEKRSSIYIGQPLHQSAHTCKRDVYKLESYIMVIRPHNSLARVNMPQKNSWRNEFDMKTPIDHRGRTATRYIVMLESPHAQANQQNTFVLIGFSSNRAYHSPERKCNEGQQIEQGGGC